MVVSSRRRAFYRVAFAALTTLALYLAYDELQSMSLEARALGSTARRISMVLPLGPGNADHKRLFIGLASLARFFDVAGSLEELLIVTPRSDVALLRRMLDERGEQPAAGAGYRRLLERTRVASDHSLVPEFSALRGARRVAGYTKQQVVKLAAAFHVRTDWYLTLDADVVCFREVGFEQLVRGGRGIATMSTVGKHRDWLAWAGGVLRTALHKEPAETPILGVTPSLLHAPTVRAMAKHIAELHVPKRGANWRAALCSWPHFVGEYALYYTYLWKMQLFDGLYDANAADGTYLSHGFSAWSSKEWASFDPKKTFGAQPPPPPGYFIVLQSRGSKIGPEVVWRKIGPFIVAKKTAAQTAAEKAAELDNAKSRSI